MVQTTSWWSNGSDFTLPVQRTQVLSLVRKLITHAVTVSLHDGTEDLQLHVAVRSKILHTATKTDADR